MSKIKQSLCIPMFWKGTNEVDIRPLIETAKRAGYAAFEFWLRDTGPFDLLVDLSKEYDLPIAAICGHHSISEGLNEPQNHDRIRNEILASIEVAQTHGIPNLICFSGNREGKDDAACISVVADGLAQVAEAAERAGITLVMELLNSKVSHPDYQCDHTAWGVEVCERVGSAAVKLLYDIYHMQIMEGDLIRTICGNIQTIGHFHTAGNPGRHDLDDAQEINYAAVMRAIAMTGYDGYVAHEFSPKGDVREAIEKAYAICNVSYQNPQPEEDAE